MFSTYDQWKLRSPEDEAARYSRWRDDEPDFYCTACKDEGWIPDEDCLVPCPECSSVVTLDNLDERCGTYD